MYENGKKVRDVAILAGVDITDPGSLLAMAQSSALVLNCVGPYRFYGEPVVQACVVAGTDYLDVCGEPGARFALLINSEYPPTMREHVATCCVARSSPAVAPTQQ